MKGALDRPLQVLVVEDNDNDVELLRIALAEHGAETVLHHVRNGEECMAFLRHGSGHAGSPVPDLVLLDLNMPRMDGREVLAAMSEDPQLCNLPVVVLSTSSAAQDITESYEHRCRSYMVKPSNYEDFAALCGAVIEYWCSLVLLPQAAKPVAAGTTPA